MPGSPRIEEAAFVVVDTETTGVRAEEDGVIELAAVRIERGCIVDRFSQLINPGRAVPRRITEITGITTAMVFDQPAMADVMPAFEAFLGEAVFVAHNLSFDQGFLDAERARLGLAPLANPTLCTLRLARRLLPGLRSKGLTSLADFFGLHIAHRHRALGDAEATAEVLRAFLKRLQFEHGLETVEEVVAFQYRTYRYLKQESKAIRRIREEVLPRVPDRPGVYFLRDAHGAVVYIGKAKRLRARVGSYFNAIEAHPPRLRKMVEVVRDVTWEETGSELRALLLESRLIKQHQPRFNRAQRRYRNRPFLRLDASAPFPRVTATPYLLDDGAEYFGPLGGRRQAELVTGVIDRFFRLRKCDDAELARGVRCLFADLGRCTAPCTSAQAAAGYAAQVQQVRDFLGGRDRSVLDLLEAEMRQAAAALQFEQAAEYRDWARRLERLLARQQRVAASVLEHNAALLLPGRAPATVDCFLVRFGRLAETLTLSTPPTPADGSRLREALAAHFDPAQERPAHYFKREADEVRLLAHWMYVHRDAVRQVPWNPEAPPGALADAVLAAVASGPVPAEPLSADLDDEADDEADDDAAG